LQRFSSFLCLFLRHVLADTFLSSVPGVGPPGV
jgi:hypothetical protein